MRDEYLIKKCQSALWAKIDVVNGRIFVKAFSKSVIVNGLICEIKRIFNGSTPDQINKKMDRFNLLNYNHIIKDSIGINEILIMIVKKSSASQISSN